MELLLSIYLALKLTGWWPLF